ncbi:MAG TPA: CotH kinase family protein [Nocardioides sp.]
MKQRLAVLATLASLTLTGCASSDSRDEASTTGVTTAAEDVVAGTGVWDASAVHDVSVEVDDAALAEMIDTYQETDEKEWIEATVTIDGERFERAGLRLKGNSSLRGVSDDADASDLPWLIRLDKFVDGQSVDGSSELVVRSNSSETALNEALALDLLAEAGLASEHAVASSFSVNGGDARLRLVVQNLDEAWEAENFSTDGLLYKAEAGGDWSYRGDDPDSYTDVFDQETGDDDLTPLIDFLDFVNNSSDEDFAAQLPQRLDVQAFARYLAFEEVVDNFDDIDGPGNNSYLRYDAESGGFTVVAWDHNLAFGGSPGGGRGAFPGGQDGERPEGMPTDLPSGMPSPPDGERPDLGDVGPGGGPGGGRMGGSNVLVERFTTVAEWSDLVDEAKADLTEELFDSGYAEQVLDQWASVLTEQAGDLVDADTVEQEADAIRESIAG